MPHVYRIETVNGDHYVTNSKGIDKDEQCDAVVRVDVIEELERLQAEVRDADRALIHALNVVSEFVGMNPAACLENEYGRKLAKLLVGTAHEDILNSCGVGDDSLRTLLERPHAPADPERGRTEGRTVPPAERVREAAGGE